MSIMENSNNNNEIVIIDIDDTIIDGQSQRLFLDYANKKGYISFITYIKLKLWFLLYKIGLINDPKKAMVYAFSFINGKTGIEINDLTNDFFNLVLKNKIFPEAKEIVKTHLDKNRKIVLLSNAVDIIVREVAEYLNIDDYISTKLEIVEGKYTGNIVGDIIYGTIKLKVIKNYFEQNNFSFANSWSYADHGSDIELLTQTAHPNAVNPTKQLKKHAIKMNWPIINFS